MKFWICDHHYSGEEGSSCFYDEATVNRRPGMVPRCVRHGETFGDTIEAPDKKAAKAKWARNHPTTTNR